MKRTVVISLILLAVLTITGLCLWTMGLTPVRVTSSLLQDSKLQVEQSRHVPLARIFDFSWRTTWEIRKSSAAGAEVLYTTDKANVSDRAEIGVLPTGKYFLRVTDAGNRMIANITFAP